MSFALGFLFALTAQTACGDASPRASSAIGREEGKTPLRIRHFREVDGVVEIMYEGRPLQSPKDARTHLGVRVDRILRGDDGRPRTAVVTVEGMMPSGAACIERRIVGPGESLAGGNVIGVVNDGVALTRHGVLYFSLVRGHAVPAFRLAWQSSFSVASPPPVGRPARTPPRPPSKR